MVPTSAFAMFLALIPGAASSAALGMVSKPFMKKSMLATPARMPATGFPSAKYGCRFSKRPHTKQPMKKITNVISKSAVATFWNAFEAFTPRRLSAARPHTITSPIRSSGA